MRSGPHTSASGLVGASSSAVAVGRGSSKGLQGWWLQAEGHCVGAHAWLCLRGRASASPGPQQPYLAMGRASAEFVGQGERDGSIQGGGDVPPPLHRSVS